MMQAQHFVGERYPSGVALSLRLALSTAAIQSESFAVIPTVGKHAQAPADAAEGHDEAQVSELQQDLRRLVSTPSGHRVVQMWSSSQDMQTVSEFLAALQWWDEQMSKQEEARRFRRSLSYGNLADQADIIVLSMEADEDGS